MKTPKTIYIIRVAVLIAIILAVALLSSCYSKEYVTNTNERLRYLQDINCQGCEHKERLIP